MDGAYQHEARTIAAQTFMPALGALHASGLTHDMSDRMNDGARPEDRPATPATARELHWRSRYEGLVTIAEIAGKAVAGISGPWSGQYALTWWDRPLATRNLELFESLEAAKREVDQWARRMQTGNAVLPRVDAIAVETASACTEATAVHADPAPIVAELADRCALPAQAGLLGWIRAALPIRAPRNAKRTTTADPNRDDLDIAIEIDARLHFSADK